MDYTNYCLKASKRPVRLIRSFQKLTPKLKLTPKSKQISSNPDWVDIEAKVAADQCQTQERLQAIEKVKELVEQDMSASQNCY